MSQIHVSRPTAFGDVCAQVHLGLDDTAVFRGITAPSEVLAPAHKRFIIIQEDERLYWSVLKLVYGQGIDV